MHHTLALAWPRSQTADPGNTSQSKQIQDQGMLAILGSHAQNTVFGFGANRKGQCGVVSQAQHGVGAGNIWEPNVGNISAGQQIVEVTPFLQPHMSLLLLTRAIVAKHRCVALHV